MTPLEGDGPGAEADRLLRRLRAADGGRRKRRSVEQIWQAFRAVVRGFTGEAAARAKLAQLLDQLEARGEITLPRGARLWDRTVRPALPLWVQLTGSPRVAAATPDHRSIAWPPELAFASELDRVPLIDELLAIKEFLAGGGRSRPVVPSRERSLELFGDEKRLWALKKTRLFEQGRLTLDLLRCRDVAPPLVWEPGPAAAAGRPLLVLENLHTHDSFRQLNAERGLWAAVAYGHGSELTGTARDLPRLCQQLEIDRVEYFGDLDTAGLEIPVRANRVLARQGASPLLEPAPALYRLLLARGAGLELRAKRAAVDDELLSWLPADLRRPVRDLLSTGRRIPQEAVGLEVLRSTPDADLR